MDLNLKGRNVIVTGGSAGIGLATARAFLEEGATVTIGSRDVRRREEAVQTLSEFGDAVFHFELDIQTDLSVERFFEDSLSAMGGLDILINNAGAAVPKDHLTGDAKDWQHDLNYKLIGYVRCTKAAIPSMMEGGGAIVIVSGTAGREPNPWTTTSGVVNAGLCNYTKTLAHALGPHRIRVNAVCPGPVATERWERLAKKDPQGAERLIEQIPVGRTGSPSDLAAPILFLASDVAGYVNGTALTVDGGRALSVAF